jgi:hypothetical protein
MFLCRRLVLIRLHATSSLLQVLQGMYELLSITGHVIQSPLTIMEQNFDVSSMYVYKLNFQHYCIHVLSYAMKMCV